MPHGDDIKRPADDGEYFERMTRALFSAGLNWRMIENKWPHFRRAFAGFSINKVAKFAEADVKRLMRDTGIVRNEKKIRSTVQNAKQFQALGKEFGSFDRFLGSFKKDERKLQEDIQGRFQHIGPTSARTFLWLSKYPLTPTKEERTWIASHPDD